jgi:hypothetical protein
MLGQVEECGELPKIGREPFLAKCAILHSVTEASKRDLKAGIEKNQ